MRKKAASLVMAVALCTGLATQNVDAASCTSHDWRITGIAGEYTSGSDHHKVYRNLFVDGQQVYSYCTITYKTTLYLEEMAGREKQAEIRSVMDLLD